MQTYQAARIRPYGNWVVVRVDDRREKIGHIHLPGELTGIESIGSRTGHVVSVGPGRREGRNLGNLDTEVDLKGVLREMLKPGDRVVFRDYIRDANPIDVEDDGEFAFIHCMDLVGVVGEDVEIGEWSDIKTPSGSEQVRG